MWMLGGHRHPLIFCVLAIAAGAAGCGSDEVERVIDAASVR